MAITRVWQAGMEENSLDIWDDYQQYVSIGTSNVKTGTYCMAVNRTSTASRWALKNLTSMSQCRLGFWMYTPTNSAGEFWCVNLRTSGASGVAGITQAGSTSLTYLKVLDTNQDSGTFEHDKLIHWGFDVKVDPTNGWFYLYKDGELHSSFDGNTGSANIAQLILGASAGTGGAPTIYIDDIYIDDTTGEASPAVVPMLRFYPLTLDGNGNYAQWDGSDGNSTDNYLLVDEVGPSDADYVETNVTDEYDSYTMTGITLDTGQTINAVIPVVRAARAGSTEQIALGTRLTSTDSIGSDQNPPTSFGYLSERQTTKPGGGSWGESDVNGAELVIKSRGTY